MVRSAQEVGLHKTGENIQLSINRRHILMRLFHSLEYSADHCSVLWRRMPPEVRSYYIRYFVFRRNAVEPAVFCGNELSKMEYPVGVFSYGNASLFFWLEN